MAQYHKRNAEFGIQAVNDAASLTATEALRSNVIEVIAKDIDSLLEQAHSKSYQSQQGIKQFNTQQGRYSYFEPTAKNRILSTLTDPNITYLLMMAGIYGLILEFLILAMLFPEPLGYLFTCC